MTNILIASEIGPGLDLVVAARGNGIFPWQRFHCRASVFVPGHYRFTRNQISPRKQLTVEIGVYTRVPIKSILLSAYTGCICFPVADVYPSAKLEAIFPTENRDAKLKCDTIQLRNM